MDPVADQVLFAHVVDRPDDEISLDVAALLIGEWEYDDLDIAHYLQQLDGFAEQVAKATERLGDAPYAGIRSLNKVLFEVLGFRGDEDDYYNPKNSFLNEVIDRRVGIPIALSVLYIEVGRRCGLEIDGVGFPGHFLVRHDEEEESLIIDPFHMGLTLDSEDLERLLSQVAGPDAELTPEMLEPIGKRQILRRMLANLASIYRREGDVRRSIAVLERMHILAPDDVRVERELQSLRRRASELN